MVDTVLSFKLCVSRAFHGPFEAFLAMISCLVSQSEPVGSGSANNGTGNNHSPRLKAADKVTGWGLPHHPALAGLGVNPALLRKGSSVGRSQTQARLCPPQCRNLNLPLLKRHGRGGGSTSACR